MNGNGAIIGPSNLPTTTVASGVWRPSYIAHQMNGQAAFNGLVWPPQKDANYSSVVGLYHFSGWLLPAVQYKDSSTKGHDLANAAGTSGTTLTLSSTQRKWWPASVSIGVLNANQYVVTGSSADFTLGTGDFCFECWFYSTLSTGFRGLWAINGTSFVRIYLSFSGDGKIQFYSGAGVTNIQGGTVTLNQWNHVILSRVSGVSYLGMNGTQQGANFTDSNNYNGLIMGLGNGDLAANSQGMNGYLQDARMTKGAGRGYTGGNYTMPTGPYPDY